MVREKKSVNTPPFENTLEEKTETGQKTEKLGENGTEKRSG